MEDIDKQSLIEKLFIEKLSVHSQWKQRVENLIS